MSQIFIYRMELFDAKKKYTINIILDYCGALDAMHGFEKLEYLYKSNAEIYADQFSPPYVDEKYAYKIIDFVREYYQTPCNQRLQMFELIKHDDEYFEFILDVCDTLFRSGGTSFSYLAYENGVVVNEDMLLS